MPLDQADLQNSAYYTLGGELDPRIIPNGLDAPCGATYALGIPGGTPIILQKRSLQGGDPTDWIISSGGFASFWATSGNAIAGGKLGTLGVEGFSFITENLVRGGFIASGEAFLKTITNYPGSERVEFTWGADTLDATPLNLFNFDLPDGSAIKFSASLQCRAQDGSEHCGFQRDLLVWKESGVLTLGIPHTLFTDKSNDDFDTQWVQSSPGVLSLQITGLAGKQIHWTGTVIYQGVTTA